MGKKTRRLRKAVARRKATKKEMKPIVHRSAAAKALSANAENFSLEQRRGWSYRELHPPLDGTQHHFTPSVSPLPHLILRDSTGTPRFTLSYVLSDKEIRLVEIQRCRTTPWAVHERLQEHDLRETLASKKFQAQLNGVHPSEFLLIHFLRAHRNEILAGKKMEWKWTVYSGRLPSNNIANTLYPALAKHYFRKVGSHSRVEDVSVSGWELDLSRLRTREALGLPALKKK